MIIIKPKYEKIIKVICTLLVISGIMGIIISFPALEGDHSIYLVFSRDMWTLPFSYGNTIKSGATSPTWALILSLIYLTPFSSDVNTVIFIVKTFSFILLFLVSVSICKLISELFDDDYNIIKWLTIAILFNQRGINGMMLGYETMLATLFIVLTILYSIKILKSNRFEYKYLLIYSILSGNLHYLRPEAILITIFTGCYILSYYFRNKLVRSNIWIIIINISIIIMFTSWYYIYFIVATNTIPISTIMTRGVLKFGVNFEGLYFLMDASFTLVFYFLSGLIPFAFGLYFLIKRKKDNKRELSMIFTIFFTFFAFYLIFNISIHYLIARYMFPIFWITIIVASIGILRIFTLFSKKVEPIKIFNILRDKKTKFVLFSSVLLISPYIIVDQYLNITRMRNKYTDIDVIFEREIIEEINDLVSNNDKILMYEIQLQYYLKCDAVSMDGIIGGEIIPYLNVGKNMSRFLLDFEITHILLGNKMVVSKNGQLFIDLYLKCVDQGSGSFSMEGNTYTILFQEYSSLYSKIIYLVKVN